MSLVKDAKLTINNRMIGDVPCTTPNLPSNTDLFVIYVPSVDVSPFALVRLLACFVFLVEKRQPYTFLKTCGHYILMTGQPFLTV